MIKPKPSEITAKFISFIEDALNKKGLSAFQAARRAELPDDSIRYVLCGSSPSLDRAFAIAKALNIDISLLSREFDQEIPSVDNAETVVENMALTRERNKIIPLNTESIKMPGWALDADHPDSEHNLVPKLNTRLATGSGVDTLGERVEYAIAFRRNRMKKYNL